MESIIMSIHPEWCELIASGKKTVEVRKSRPKLETPFKVYIYCTKADKTKALVVDNNHARAITCTNYEHTIAVGCYLGNGKIIGEFVCDKVVMFRNEDYDYIFEETADRSCLNSEKLTLYLGKNKFGFGWHISDLVIYDKPREIYEFLKPCVDEYNYCQGCDFGHCVTPSWVETAEDLEYCTVSTYCTNRFTRPPQSWCYTDGYLPEDKST